MTLEGGSEPTVVAIDSASRARGLWAVPDATGRGDDGTAGRVGAGGTGAGSGPFPAVGIPESGPGEAVRMPVTASPMSWEAEAGGAAVDGGWGATPPAGAGAVGPGGVPGAGWGGRAGPAAADWGSRRMA